MDPAVTALAAAGVGVLGTFAGQWLAGRREDARLRFDAEREERRQRWETNSERLIELRSLLDDAAVKLRACEQAGTDAWERFRTLASLAREADLQPDDPEIAVDRREAGESFDAAICLFMERQDALEGLEGRLEIRLGAAHPATRLFSVATKELIMGCLVLESVLPAADFSAATIHYMKSKDAERASGYLSAATKHRWEFFEQARQLVGVEVEPVRPDDDTDRV
jgi:hypothetical protein